MEINNKLTIQGAQRANNPRERIGFAPVFAPVYSFEPAGDEQTQPIPEPTGMQYIGIGKISSTSKVSPGFRLILIVAFVVRAHLR